MDRKRSSDRDWSADRYRCPCCSDFSNNASKIQCHPDHYSSATLRDSLRSDPHCMPSPLQHYPMDTLPPPPAASVTGAPSVSGKATRAIPSPRLIFDSVQRWWEKLIRATKNLWKLKLRLVACYVNHVRTDLAMMLWVIVAGGWL